MIDRRQMIATVAAAAAGLPFFARRARAQAAMSRMTAYGFSFQGLKGGDIRLADFAGKPLLVVNTASLCGFTPQYAGLQEIWTQFRDRGLTVIGVPSNDFGAQEPGGASDITQTAEHTYHVTFPITAKTAVKGPNAHPFYKWGRGRAPGGPAKLELPQVSGRPATATSPTRSPRASNRPIPVSSPPSPRSLTA